MSIFSRGQSNLPFSFSLRFFLVKVKLTDVNKQKKVPIISLNANQHIYHALHP